LRFLSIAICFSSVLFAADADFAKWWPQFQAAAARGDAKTVVEGSRFPMQWENGPVREIKTSSDLIQHFEVYFTPEIKKAIAHTKPVKSGYGEWDVTWKARGNEYSIFFKPVGSGYVLGGLTEGPP
jgi:hypothetical protein